MSFIDRIIDWHHETRGMALGMAAAVGVLIFGLWWFSEDWTSAGRAARDAVRTAVGDPALNVGKPDIRPRAVIDGRRTYRTLVCGWIENDVRRPFAALVREDIRRRSGPSWGNRDRVEALVLPEKRAPTVQEAALLRACAENGPRTPGA